MAFEGSDGSRMGGRRNGDPAVGGRGSEGVGEGGGGCGRGRGGEDFAGGDAVEGEDVTLGEVDDVEVVTDAGSVTARERGERLV